MRVVIVTLCVGCTAPVAAYDAGPDAQASLDDAAAVDAAGDVADAATDSAPAHVTDAGACPKPNEPCTTPGAAFCEDDTRYWVCNAGTSTWESDDCSDAGPNVCTFINTGTMMRWGCVGWVCWSGE